MRNSFNGNKFAVYSSAEESVVLGAKPLDLYASIRGKRSEVSSVSLIPDPSSPVSAISDSLDVVQWLPFAARAYNISPNLRDYILIPFILMLSDLPNRNGVAFPLKELLRWNTETSCQAYKGWKGKPGFYEHANSDPSKAIGVVADVAIRRLHGFGGDHLWKIIALYALDRARAPDIAQRVLDGDINSASMGSYVDSYYCPLCNSDIGNCSHISKTRPLDFSANAAGQLIFRNVRGVTPFELSLVETPAYLTCISDHRITLE